MGQMMRLANRQPEEWLSKPLESLLTMMEEEMMTKVAVEAATTTLSGRMLVLDGVFSCFSSHVSSDTSCRSLQT